MAREMASSDPLIIPASDDGDWVAPRNTVWGTVQWLLSPLASLK